MSSKKNVDEKELTEDVADTFADSSSIQFNKIQSTISPPIKSPTAKFAAHYNMDKRGLAIIFNHENFSFDNLLPRRGTDKDSENMKNTLQSLGFIVKECKDFTYQQINLTLQAVAKQDHTDHDCLIVCILTYGDLKILYARDKHYKADSIWSYFTLSKSSTDCNYKDNKNNKNEYNENDKEKETEEKTFTLIGKPKLFFIQTTDIHQYTTNMYSRGATRVFTVPDSMTDLSTFRLPNHADFLIAYSTYSDYYSLVLDPKVKYGPTFIEALGKVLNDFGNRYDLLTLLTLVCRYVREEHKINIDGDEIIQKNEILYITSMLTRLLKFKAAEN